MDGGEEVVDAFFGDVPAVEGGVAFWGEGICVEGDEGIGGFVGSEGVVEGQQAGEVGRVCYEGCPDCAVSGCFFFSFFTSPHILWTGCTFF